MAEGVFRDIFRCFFTVNDMEKKYKIGGMACNGCVANVERALRALPEVEEVKVELAGGIATVKGAVSDEKIAETIENIGFDFLGVE